MLPADPVSVFHSFIGIDELNDLLQGQIAPCYRLSYPFGNQWSVLFVSCLFQGPQQRKGNFRFRDVYISRFPRTDLGPVIQHVVPYLEGHTHVICYLLNNGNSVPGSLFLRDRKRP